MVKKLSLLFLLCVVFLSHTSVSQTDTARVNDLNNLSWKLKSSNLDTAILLSSEALKLIPKIPNENLSPQWKEKAYVRTYYYLGYSYNQAGNNSASINCFNRGLAIADSIGYLYGKSLVTGGIGSFYQTRANYSKALERYFEGLSIDEKRGDKEGILVRLSNIGTIYDIEGKYDKAIEYFSRSLKLAQELGKKKHISILLGNIGIVYYEQNDFPRAIEFHTKALAMDRELNQKEGIARNLNNIGSIYKDQKDYDKAFDYFTQALVISEEVGDAELLSTEFGNLGYIYEIRKDYNKAEESFIKALKLAYETESLDIVSEFELALSDFYTKQGKDKQSLEHYKKYTLAKDSIFNEEHTSKIVRTEMNYEFEKQQALQQKEHEKTVIALEADNRIQKQLHIFLLILIALILLILFFMKRAYDGKKRIAQFMAEENTRKETLLQEVHHRINNNLQVISSLLSLQANSVGDERLQNYLQQSQNRIQSLSTLHELLYQNDSPLQINMEEYMNKVLDFHRDVLSTKKPGVTIESDISSVYFATKLAVPVALVVNELATNAIKYAFNAVESGRIRVSLSPNVEKDNTWVLSFSDNGAGLPQETAVRKESLGLRLVNMMARQMGALTTKSNSPGATFTFVFPVTN